MKIIRYFLEFILVISFFLIFKIIGLKLSSELGEIIGKYFGPLFRKKAIAKKNIIIAFPNIDETSINQIIDGMWKNVGRIFGEYIHINKFSLLDKEKNKIIFINKNFIAFAGIGNPYSFFNTLLDNKVNIVKQMIFPDHFQFTEKNYEILFQEAEKNNCNLITTEKDYVRINDQFKNKIYYTKLSTKLIGKEILEKELKKLF